MKVLPLLLAVALAGCRIAPTAPSARAVPEPKAWRVVSVVASSTPESLVFCVRTEGEQIPLLFALGLNTDDNEETGMMVRGGPDYLTGSVYPDPRALYFASRWTRTLAPVSKVALNQRRNAWRLTIAWADLRGAWEFKDEPTAPAIPWRMAIYDGTYVDARWIGDFEGTYRTLLVSGVRP